VADHHILGLKSHLKPRRDRHDAERFGHGLRLLYDFGHGLKFLYDFWFLLIHAQSLLMVDSTIFPPFLGMMSRNQCIRGNGLHENRYRCDSEGVVAQNETSVNQ
jgi:hypothetical protein